MSSPIRRTTSPLASSPLALPTLHLGSFSDLQLGFTGESNEANGPSVSSQSFAVACTNTCRSAPVLRDSTINRRKTYITPSSHPTSPLRQPIPLSLDIPPPVPRKDRERGTPSPITDHPDYADFVYRPRAGTTGMKEEGGYALGGAVAQGQGQESQRYDQQVSNHPFFLAVWCGRVAIARVVGAAMNRGRTECVNG